MSGHVTDFSQANAKDKFSPSPVISRQAVRGETPSALSRQPPQTANVNVHEIIPTELTDTNYTQQQRPLVQEHTLRTASSENENASFVCVIAVLSFGVALLGGKLVSGAPLQVRVGYTSVQRRHRNIKRNVQLQPSKTSKNPKQKMAASATASIFHTPQTAVALESVRACSRWQKRSAGSREPAAARADRREAASIRTAAQAAMHRGCHSAPPVRYHRDGADHPENSSMMSRPRREQAQTPAAAEPSPRTKSIQKSPVASHPRAPANAASSRS